MTSSDLRNHLLGNCACPLLLFLPARVILSSLLSTHVYAHVDALQRSQQMKIQRLDSSEAEIMLCGRKWTPSSNRPQSTTALLMLIKRCFPWRRPLTSLGHPDDAVVCACHRCAGCTQSEGSQCLGDLMHVFMIKIPNPDGSATQFQLRFLDISNPSRPGPDLPDPELKRRLLEAYCQSESPIWLEMRFSGLRQRKDQSIRDFAGEVAEPGVQRTPSRALPAGAGDSQKGIPVGGICNRYRGRPAANNRRRCLGERRPSQDCGNFGAALGQDGKQWSASSAVTRATFDETVPSYGSEPGRRVLRTAESPCLGDVRTQNKLDNHRSYLNRQSVSSKVNGLEISLLLDSRAVVSVVPLSTWRYFKQLSEFLVLISEMLLEGGDFLPIVEDDSSVIRIICFNFRTLVFSCLHCGVLETSSDPFRRYCHALRRRRSAGLPYLISGCLSNLASDSVEQGITVLDFIHCCNVMRLLIREAQFSRVLPSTFTHRHDHRNLCDGSSGLERAQLGQLSVFYSAYSNLWPA
ncbi:hypothetical protein T05_14582 [Trichinella murrelli]|uniref:Uncharacterized protein n=1 Tax=Trichinella murrelli TaxID=144512 RepID=A0A0V0T2T6_9BILA|nr:hypothetical protein T05_14582 [Trichinella murrelli]